MVKGLGKPGFTRTNGPCSKCLQEAARSQAYVGGKLAEDSVQIPALLSHTC